MKLPVLPSFVFKPVTLLVLYIIGAIFAAVQLYSLGTHIFTFPKDPYPDDIMNHLDLMNQFLGRPLTEYNNYRIFKYSYFHLIHGENLYGLYPALHWDFFKYSPTFALLMAPMAYLSDIAGLIGWNILNAITVYFAVRMLPFTTRKQAILLWFAGFEMLTCLQNTQSNGLMCGLMIAAFACMENGKTLWATLWIALATYIKVYGAIGFCLILFYPGRLKFVLYSALWMIVLGVLPLVVTPFQTLMTQYHNWAILIKEDAKSAVGLSVAGWLHTWFGIDQKALVSLIGVILFFVPLTRYKMYANQTFRLMMLAFMLLWVIIFNHKSESSTFIIAVAGVGIWYFANEKANWRLALMILVLLFTSMSTTDIFPPYVKKHFIYSFTIKAVPCILVWCVVFVEMMLMPKPKPNQESNAIAS